MKEIVKCEALWISGEVTHHEFPRSEISELDGLEVMDHIEASLDRGLEIESVDFWVEVEK